MNGELLEDWVNVVYAEKLNDAINLDRSVYLADLNNDITIYFDQDGDFVHSSSTWNDNWYRNDGVPSEVASSVEAQFPIPKYLNYGTRFLS